MRIIYTVLFYCLTPFILLRLFWRGIKAPDYRLRWLERFGFYKEIYPQSVIWFHAVSVGEAEALFPLLKLILQHHSDAQLLITTTTPTGSARVKAVMGNTVSHVYLPYDMPDSIARFMAKFKPKMAVIMETELWPNLFIACGQNTIPLYVINARLSDKSARGYKKIPTLVNQALAQVKTIATQTQDDADRFVSIGAHSDGVVNLGNIKFDVDVPSTVISAGADLKNTLFAQRFVWIIASTHTEEEAIFVALYKQLKLKIPELLLILVPRHPERFSDVKQLCIHQDLNVVLRTTDEIVVDKTDVYLADTMGELKLLYAAADVAFVGGSMVPIGGHNILEASVIGVPVMFGPYMANFKEISRRVLEQQAAIQCKTTAEVIDTLLALYQDAEHRSAFAERGKYFIKQNQGAVNRVYALLSSHIS